MLFALLIGIAFHFLSEDETCATGIDFAAKTLLRFGVGLLGLRLGLAEVMSLGFTPSSQSSHLFSRRWLAVP